MSDRLTAELARIAALPADAPEGLPGWAYTDPAVWEREQQMLRRGWHCIGRADALPEVGDYTCTTVLDEPLLIVRADDRLRVLVNSCRHRGLPVADGAGRAKRFICAYHAWTYGLDGALLRAPRMKNGGFDAARCGLPELPVEQWRGFLYTRLDGDAPFDAGALDDLVAPYRPEDFTLVHEEVETWACNWKSLLENFMEGYHLSVVHPTTLHDYTPTGLSRKGPDGPAFTSYFANYPDSAAARGDGAPGLTQEQIRRSTLFALYPLQVASCAASLLVSLNLHPKGPGQTEVHWTMSAWPGEFDEAAINARVALWQEVNREDREKLERLQGALVSRFANGGPLAGPDLEGTVRDIHLWYAGAMAAG